MRSIGIMSRRSSLILALLLSGSAQAGPKRGAQLPVTIHYTHVGWDHINFDRSITAKDKAYASWRSALGGALTDLLPSDGLKQCTSHTDDYPSFDIRLPDPQGGTVELRSASNCGLFAPWNVIRQGKLFVQVNGKLGEALLPLLRALDAKVFARAGGKLDSVDLAGGEVPPGVKAQVPPWRQAVATLALGPAFQGAFKGKAATVERATCDPGKSPGCHELELALNILLAPRVSLGATATLSGDLATFTAPPGAAALTALVPGKLFQQLLASGTGDVLISQQTAPACDKWPAYLQARTQRVPGAPATCAAYRVAPPGEKFHPRDFYLYFFPDLGLTWVDSASSHPGDFLTSLGASADQVASVRSKLVYLDAAGKVTVLAP